jgi:PncC family amidohydrolase
MNNQVNNVIELLKESNLTLSSCESLTGGLFASTITSFSGVSNFFKGSLVTYQNEVKENLLKISADLINTQGVVSKEIAYQMCEKTSKLLSSDICISFTGNAGPSAMENKEVGLVYIGICYLNEIEVYEYHFQGDRNSIREQVVLEGFKIIEKKLVKNQ